MELLETVEQLGAVRALKTSFFAYPIVNALHIMSIGALWTSVLLIDLRILGAFVIVDQAALIKLLRRVALISFSGALLTGVSMFAVRASEYAAMRVFLAKMALIVLAGANFVLFQRFARYANESAVGSAKLLAATSLGLWTAALVAGRFIGFM